MPKNFYRWHPGISARPQRQRNNPSRGPSSGSSTGHVVQPGQVINRAERDRRKNESAEDESQRVDSITDTLDGQNDGYAYSWKALGDKFSTNSGLAATFDAFDEHVWAAPGSDRFRALILLLISVLLVFGALYTLVNYLLAATRASALCTPSTVYIPVTYTVTVPSFSSSALSSPVGASNSGTVTLTSTSTETSTSYITIGSAVASTGGSPYYYSVNSEGVTEWRNGNSPTAGALLTTVTSSITVHLMASVPSKAVDSATNSQTTMTDLETVTPPAYTSTIYSLVTPDLTTTSTSTRTHYVTFTLSQVTPSTGVNTAPSSFSSMKSSGWNVTTTADPSVSAQAVDTANPTDTTLTGIYFIGSGEKTSTTTTFITTTLAFDYTVTITEPVTSSAETGYVTTITALPVTITPGTSAFSATISGPGLNSSSSASNSSLAGADSATLSSSSLVAGNNSTSFTASTSAVSSVAPHLTQTGHVTSSSSSSSTVSAINITTTVTALRSYTPMASSSLSLNVSLASVSALNTSVVSALSNSHSTPSSEGNTSVATLTTSHSTLSVISTMSQLSSETTPSSSVSLASATTSASSGSVSAVGISTASNSSAAAASQTNSASTSSSTASTTTSYGYSPLRSVLSNSSTATAAHSTSSSLSSPLSAASTSSSLLASHHSSQAQSDTTTASRHTTSMTTTLSTITSKASANTTSSSSFSNPFPPSSATATPTAGCGEHGDFMIDFDDLSNFTPSNQNNTDITQAPPIFSPYHHLAFSDGYVYAPQPDEPYQPESMPHLAVFLANASGVTASAFGNSIKPGEIGDGPRDDISAFWFDAFSAFFGCDNAGPSGCTLVMKGYTWSESAGTEIMAYAENTTVSPCPALKDCQLQQIAFPTSFRSLSGLQIQAYVDNVQKMFFMDNLALAWSNNTCAAGLLRQSSP